MGNLSQDSHPSGGASHHHVTYPFGWRGYSISIEKKGILSQKERFKLAIY
jgi:hypothetical protein